MKTMREKVSSRVHFQITSNSYKQLKDISNKEHLSLSALIRKIVLEWLEEYNNGGVNDGAKK